VGHGRRAIPFTSTIKLMNWYPMLTLPMFVWMGYVMSETRMADDLYRMFHVWFGPIPGGLAIGTILLMVLISAMNGLSVAGLAIGATIALPEMLKRGYDKVHDHRRDSGRIQPGHPDPALGCAGALRDDRPAAGRATLAGRGVPGPADGGVFILYIVIRCWRTRALPRRRCRGAECTWSEKLRLLSAGAYCPWASSWR
jgi:hypothetical protein